MDSQNTFSNMIFLQLPENEKIEIINQMHEETKLPQVIIEKDLWVTAVLRALFALPYTENLSFKGGTSLSKCWNFRHTYDIARMIDTPIAENALKNKDLFQSIVAHRRMFIAMKGFDYDTLSPKTIKIIPPDSVIAKWEDDYNRMQTMIYGKLLSFNEIIDKITQLNEQLNGIEW